MNAEDIRAALRGRELGEEVVPLAGPKPTDPVQQVTVRQLPPDVWEGLVAEHPPSEEGAKVGEAWDPLTFRPALIAASIVDDDGAAVFSAEDIIEAAALGWLTIGQLLTLWDTACALNDRTPAVADLGKDSAPIPSSPGR